MHSAKNCKSKLNLLTNTHKGGYNKVVGSQKRILTNILLKGGYILEQWIAKAVGLMHIHRITQKQLAEKMGYTREYIGMILNGKKSPPNIKERIFKAIDEILAERSDNNTHKSILERQKR